jgi:hypothetical protein
MAQGFRPMVARLGTVGVEIRTAWTTTRQRSHGRMSLGMARRTGMCMTIQEVLHWGRASRDPVAGNFGRQLQLLENSSCVKALEVEEKLQNCKEGLREEKRRGCYF